MSSAAKSEILEAIRERYGRSSKVEKGRILHEFKLVTGCHRKHAIRFLKSRGKSGKEPRVASKRLYDQALKEALIVIWETADRICGKRLKAAIPNLVEAMERHGHLKLESELRKKVLSVSAATIDRKMIVERKTAGIRRKRRAKKKVNKDIPIKTFADWKNPMLVFLRLIL